MFVSEKHFTKHNTADSKAWTLRT